MFDEWQWNLMHSNDLDLNKHCYLPPLLKEENMCWQVSWPSLALDGILTDVSTLALTSSVISTSSGSDLDSTESKFNQKIFLSMTAFILQYHNIIINRGVAFHTKTALCMYHSEWEIHNNYTVNIEPRLLFFSHLCKSWKITRLSADLGCFQLGE